MWALDRCLRYGRVIVVSLLPRLKGVKALATYDQQTDMIRLDVTDYFGGKQPRPGTFYYLYEGLSLRGYENHPFTLCTWRDSDGSERSSQSESIDRPNDFDDKEMGSVVVSNANQIGSLRHTLLIRPYSGYTARLREKLMASKETTSCSATLLLEGPYGEHINLQKHSDVLIVAGGSGITAAISQSYAFLSSNNKASLRIIWAVRKLDLVDNICAHELRVALESDRIHLEVFLTPVKTLNDSTVASGKYTIHTGRPDIYSEISKAREISLNSLAVVCCGKPKMADACRKAVVGALGKPGVDVEFYNETSGW